MKNLEVASDCRNQRITRSDVLNAVNANNPDADELGAAYLRQQFPPRSTSQAYFALLHAASGIDYGKKHEAVVDFDRTVVDITVEEQREAYEQAVYELDLAAKGVYLSSNLSA